MILQRFRMQECEPINNPNLVGLKLSVEQWPKTKEDVGKMSWVPYKSVKGSLMHAMVYTRPNIAYAVGVRANICLT